MKRQTDNNNEPFGPLPVDPDIRAAAEMCNRIAELDRLSIPNVDGLSNQEGLFIFDVLPHCPPTMNLAEISTIFERLSDQTRTCYQSTITFEPFAFNLLRPYRFVSVCCYNMNDG